MRFDHFLPYQKKPHTARRLLKTLGSAWASSPVRCCIQATCFALFLLLFFYVCWPYGSSEYARTRSAKELIPAESFLALDPLVSLSTALAAKTWVFSLAWTAVVLLVCIVIPRGFCGYICPLGTLIDLFDWLLSQRLKQYAIERDGWWVNLKYYLLVAVLLSSLYGILLSGFVAAIPIITRGLLFTLAPLQMGSMKGWYLVPPVNAGHYISIALFLIVLGLGILRPRFWCRYVCPTGAVFSITSLLRITERKIRSTCINCDRCVTICPFDAIKPNDYTTRTADCTLCQTCAGVCPTHSITFVSRWVQANFKPSDESSAARPLSRRGLISGVATGIALAIGIRRVAATPSTPPVRPPGSVPEDAFLQLCIRCGECFKACPNNVLQPIGFEHGLNHLWTPQVAANWSGCEPSCNNCGQVCPTAAIRPLPIEEKRVVRMGLAIINEQTCLPHAQIESCQMCVDECAAAGYNAIEFRRVGAQADENGVPVHDTGFLAPVVLPDKCVGCGLCQTRCYTINVKQKYMLMHTAVEIFAGAGKEDRLRSGSYLAVREKEQLDRQKLRPAQPQDTEEYLPDFLR